ncbi:MAG: cupin domain-containing protein [Gammaproteobacteria bacterium]|nr:cupin domain-containing protein [Gammaproteobacteria bacterium]
MARIIAADGTETTDFPAIRARLARLGIALSAWPAPTTARAKELLDKQTLNDAEKEELLASVQNRFEELQREKGYKTRDMIVIHENIPGLGDMLAKFDKIHYHTDDEVRYILAGSGYFGFVEASGDQFLLEVSAGDYINVPANTEHWFEMKDSKRIKAVRYFIDTSGWTPVYTERKRGFAEVATA